jgi:hypothetical protein
VRTVFILRIETHPVVVLNYQIGAFEALQWAWHMLRMYKDQPSGIEEARKAIQEILADMGKGSDFNFGDKLSREPFSP